PAQEHVVTERASASRGERVSVLPDPAECWNIPVRGAQARADGTTGACVASTRQSTTWARLSSGPTSPTDRSEGRSAHCLPARGQCASEPPRSLARAGGDLDRIGVCRPAAALIESWRRGGRVVALLAAIALPAWLRPS